MASPQPSWNSPLLLPLLPVAMRSSSISTAGPARHGRRSARNRAPLRSQRTLADAALSPGPAGLLGVAGDGRCHRGERRHRPASPPLSPDAPAREVGDELDRRAPRVSEPVGRPARLSGDSFHRYRLPCGRHGGQSYQRRKTSAASRRPCSARRGWGEYLVSTALEGTIAVVLLVLP